MPLLYETGGYMLTWPRLLVTSDPAVQVRPKSCQLQPQSESVMAQLLIWLPLCRPRLYTFLLPAALCTTHMQICSTASVLVTVSSYSAGGEAYEAGSVQQAAGGSQDCIADATGAQAAEVSVHREQFWQPKSHSRRGKSPCAHAPHTFSAEFVGLLHRLQQPCPACCRCLNVGVIS